MAHIVFVHGLDNKPESGYLHQLWKRKLGHDNGPDLDANGVSGSMVYWADVFYPEPDTNLAAYERAAGDIELCGGPLHPWAADAGLPEELARVRRLAERCGVDLSAPGAIEPAAEEIAAVQQERVPVPAWLRYRVMARLVRDAHHYFFNLEICAARGGALPRP